MTRAVGLRLDEHPKTHSLPPNTIFLLRRLALFAGEAGFIAEILLRQVLELVACPSSESLVGMHEPVDQPFDPVPIGVLLELSGPLALMGPEILAAQTHQARVRRPNQLMLRARE